MISPHYLDFLETLVTFPRKDSNLAYFWYLLQYKKCYCNIDSASLDLLSQWVTWLITQPPASLFWRSPWLLREVSGWGKMEFTEVLKYALHGIPAIMILVFKVVFKVVIRKVSVTHSNNCLSSLKHSCLLVMHTFNSFG